MPDVKTSTMKALRLAGELRRLRSEAGLTMNVVAGRLGWDASKISRQERGKAGISVRDLHGLLDVYDVPPRERGDLEALIGEGRVHHWWREYEDVLTPNLLTYVALEAEAARLCEYQVVAVPGLLQTRAYAEAMNAGSFRSLGEEQVEASVELRIRRQARLTRAPEIELHALISEAVLCFRTGTAEVMRGQVLHLVEMARLPNVRLQVVPFAAGRAGVHVSGFMMLHFDAEPEPDLLFVESLSGILPRESKREVRRCARVFAQVEQVALSPADSADFLKRKAEEM